jgi:hypothetical protein
MMACRDSGTLVDSLGRLRTKDAYFKQLRRRALLAVPLL